MINDTMIDDFEKGIKELKDNDAIEQSLALVEIVKDLLDTTKKHLNRVYLLLGISLVVNFLTVGSFLLYESQFEYEATTEEVITTETTDNSVITQDYYDQNNDKEKNDCKTNEIKQRFKALPNLWKIYVNYE